MNNIENEILNIFVEESLESLDAWEKCCLSLVAVDGGGHAKPVRNSENAGAVAHLFRLAHNMKGSSKSVGLAALGAFVHVVEDLILDLKDGRVSVSFAVSSLLLKCEATLRAWLEDLRVDPKRVPDTTDLRARLIAARQAWPVLSPSDDSSEATAFSEETLAALGSATEGDIIFISEPKPAPVSLPVAPPSAVATTNANESIRIPASRIDALIQIAGELSIQTSILSHAHERRTLDSKVSMEAISILAKLTRELQSRALSFRMQTVQGTMQRLERVAREAAAELGKDVAISIEGGDVELDKSVLERMIDPLVHMVRNAIDHGVETNEERALSGKSPRSNVRFSARQAPDGVTIVVSDDGRGLDPKKIREHAERKGLLQPGAKLTEQETFALIFVQGFSTAKAVTSISGRGVGMEVVERAVSELGGHISIESTLGKGTTFLVSLPSSVSIVDALIVSVSGNRYAIPLSQVDEVLNSQDLTVENALDGQRMFELREQVIPLHDLRSSLGMGQARTTKTSTAQDRSAAPQAAGMRASCTVLVVRSHERRLGLAVDFISGQQQVVVRKLGGALESMAGFVGGTILGDGEPGFIVDVPYWSERYFKQRRRAA